MIRNLMIRNLITTCFLLGLSNTLMAQQRTLGLTFDREAFGTLPAFPDPEQGAKSLEPLPLTADLSMYAPPVGNQGNVPSCVAWSTAYAAYTIQYAAQKKITDPTQLMSIALSAMLPYKQLRPSCNDGLSLNAIADQIRDNGDVSHTEFGSSNCAMTPSSDMVNKARQNRPIKEMVRVFGPADSNNQKIYFTQRQIATFNNPVVVGIQVTDQLERLAPGTDYYRPGGNYRGMHAVVVVGYDRVSFKILNSWGPQWGNNGYFSVRFEDFAQIAVGGMALVLPDQYVPGPTTTVQVGGTFGFQYLDYNGNFNQVAPFHINNGIYEVSRKDWRVGSRFQLLTNTDRPEYMCVFSINPKNEVKAHWPLNSKLAAVQDNNFGMEVSDIIPKSNFDQVIPAKDKVLAIAESGTDYLCVIFSDKPLMNEIPGILGRIRNSTGDIYSRLKAGLGNRLIPTRNISYQSNQMGASASTSQGDVIPLVLKIQSVN